MAIYMVTTDVILGYELGEDKNDFLMHGKHTLNYYWYEAESKEDAYNKLTNSVMPPSSREGTLASIEVEEFEGQPEDWWKEMKDVIGNLSGGGRI